MNKTDRKAIKSLMCALRPGNSYCHSRDFIADSFTLPVLLQIFFPLRQIAPTATSDKDMHFFKIIRVS